MLEASPAFDVSTERIEGGTVVVSVLGDVDIATARALEQTLFDVAEHQRGGVIVDLTGCGFIDSRGVRTLIASRARLDRSDRSLALVLSNPSVLRILQIMHLDEVFEIYSALGTAWAATVVGSWRQRESETQARSREDNAATARSRSSAEGMRSFRCECGDQSCTRKIRLTAQEYESVRAYATQFVIALNHENPESEHVIEEHERFATVATVSSEATKLARRSYARQWRRQQRSSDPARSESARR
jgi:anti-sigma B factor antagonist